MKNINHSKDKIVNIIKIVAVIILLAIILLSVEITFTAEDGIIAPSRYKVRINRITRVTVIEEYHSCSYIDCVPTEEKTKFVLKKEDYDLVKKIMNKYGNKANLSIARALSNLSKGKEKYCQKKEMFYEEKEDLNKDGIITYEESGHYLLEELLED